MVARLVSEETAGEDTVEDAVAFIVVVSGEEEEAGGREVACGSIAASVAATLEDTLEEEADEDGEGDLLGVLTEALLDVFAVDDDEDDDGTSAATTDAAGDGVSPAGEGEGARNIFEAAEEVGAVGVCCCEVDDNGRT